jgi:hypothetical protein
MLLRKQQTIHYQVVEMVLLRFCDSEIKIALGDSLELNVGIFIAVEGNGDVSGGVFGGVPLILNVKRICAGLLAVVKLPALAGELHNNAHLGKVHLLIASSTGVTATATATLGAPRAPAIGLHFRLTAVVVGVGAL